MLTNNFALYGGKIFFDLIKEILYFPLWWYSRGLIQIFIRLKNFLVYKQRMLCIIIWIKNIFRPMYGQYDLPGQIISFFVRLFQIIARSLIFLFWFIICLLALFFWLILPILVIYEIIFQTAL